MAEIDQKVRLDGLNENNYIWSSRTKYLLTGQDLLVNDINAFNDKQWLI